jgi:hypothetical protein
VGKGGVEAEQDGEGLTPALRRPDGLTVEGRLLDPSGGGRDLRISHPGLALGVEFSGVEAIEQLAEEIGVFLGHT